MLTISRDNVYRDKLRSYKIIIDGNYCDEIKCGEIKNINLAPGNHTIYLKIDWCRSNKIDFTVLENETVEFECGNPIDKRRILSSIIYITFLKNKYLWIRKKINEDLST